MMQPLPLGRHAPAANKKSAQLKKNLRICRWRIAQGGYRRPALKVASGAAVSLLRRMLKGEINGIICR